MKHPRITLATFLGAVFVLATVHSSVHQPFVPRNPLAPDLSAQQGLQVTRGPYLQMGTSSSVVVRWRTNSASDSQVLYGPDAASLIWSAVVSTNTTEHVVTLSGLTANSKFY